MSVKDPATLIESTSTSQRSVDYADPLQAFYAAQGAGWIPYFEAAAKKAEWLSAALLIGVGYRESWLNPKYLSVSGDKGNGFGIMQVDKRSYPEWVSSGEWKDARSCIEKGAEILIAKRTQILDSISHTCTLTSSKGEKVTFIGKSISGEDLVRTSVAAYNCGLWAYYHYSMGNDVDRGTTGSNYSRDVLSKAVMFSGLLDPDRFDFGYRKWYA